VKLYMHPVSMTSRPVRLLIAENGLEVDEQMVDLMAGEHYQEPFASLNPNRLVPVLEDGDLRLTESSAILKYLADKFDLPSYPKDLRQRAKVNEMMDWFNTNFYRDFGYGWIYPQLFPHHRRPDDAAQQATVAWGKERAKTWLKVLNDHWLGDGRPYLTGQQITIADYFGVCLLTLGEVLGCDFAAYPNVARWVARMKQLPSWPRINEALYGYAEAVKGQPFVMV
jgi:glutathione S-transferase